MAGPSIPDSAIADLITSTRPDEGRGRFQQIAQRVTHYTVMGRLMKDEKQEFQSGTKIQGNLLINHSFAFQMVGLHQVIEPSVPTLMGTFEVDWRHFNFNWPWERREVLMNRSKSALFKLLEARRVGAAISAFEGLESLFWAPSVGDTSLDIYPIFYWVPKATTNAAGFNGKNPIGFNNCGGIDATNSANERWRSWNAAYEEVSDEDLLFQMGRAFRRTKFVSPVTHEDYSRGKAMDNRIYMNETTISACEQEARSRNDNHGNDLGKFHDSTAFKRLPLEYVDKLDEHADDPVLYINWQNMAFIWLEGDYMHEHDPKNDANQPNTWVTHTDGTCNTCCTDRRRQACINKVAA